MEVIAVKSATQRKSEPAASIIYRNKPGGRGIFEFTDNRKITAAQASLQRMMEKSSRMAAQRTMMNRLTGNATLDRGNGVSQLAVRGGEDLDGATDFLFRYHQRRRRRWGMPAAGTIGDNDTVARLIHGPNVYWGRNAHGRPYPIGFVANAQSRTHAEGDVFIQVFNAGGAGGGTGTLDVDRGFCGACGVRGGMHGMATSAGFNHINATTTKNSDAGYSF